MENNAMVTTHELKTHPKYFNDVINGTKSFELRRDDRNYNTGDNFILREWDPNFEDYTGRIYEGTIKYVLRNCKKFGLIDGYCIFGW